MSTKIITLPERFSTGEPTVQLVATPGLYGKTLRERTSLHNVKTASESPALDFIRSIEPQPGKTIVLVVGLGDHETYGPNRNGDGFPSEPVPGKINADDVLTKHYQSYDNAHVFEHHVNNDPSKAIGKVIKAFWNPHMRRVEVLESFDHDKAPHMLEKIMAGEHPAKSMGCAPAGELVLTAAGPRPIENIQVGDLVVSHTGQLRRVTELHRRPYAGMLYTVRTGEVTSTMTADHPYGVHLQDAAQEIGVVQLEDPHVRWVPAKHLQPGMRVLLQGDLTAFAEISEIYSTAFSGTVYNFEVEVDNSYVIGTHAVHNCKIPYDVCFPAGTLIHTDDGNYPIEDVEPGMRVYTHQGRLRTVNATHIREHVGMQVTLDVRGMPGITATDEHPFWVIREEDLRTCQGSANGKRLRHSYREGEDTCFRCGKRSAELLELAAWVAAKDVRPGDYLLTFGGDRAENREAVADEDLAFARFLGYYLGDGCLVTQRRGAARDGEAYVTGVSITVGSDYPEHLEELQRVIGRLSLANPAGVYPSGGGKRAVQVVINNRPFAEKVRLLSGQYSRGKLVPDVVYQWSREQQLNLLAGYIDTDGCADAKGIRVASVNRGLLLDMQRLCHALGVAATVTLHGNSDAGYSRRPTPTWILGIPAGAAAVLKAYSLKARNCAEPHAPSPTACRLGRYYAYAVQQVTHAPYSGRVYNLAVEEDESYVAEGLIVHNCTICGNRAATRREYCDHLKYEMGKIYPDGTQSAALNPKPKFFDSSWVIRPADRTGLMLKKVAREAAYEIRTASYDLGEMAENLRAKAAALGKAAVMEKIISGGNVEASSTGTDKGTVTLIKKYNETSASDDAANMPAPSKAMKVIIEYSPEDAVGTTDAMGMPMGLKDLLKYFMVRMGAGEPDSVTEDCACKHAGVVAELFANYPRFYDDVMKTAGLVNLRVNPELAQKLAAATPGTFQHENQTVHDTPLNTAHPHFGSGQAALRPNTDRLSYTDQYGRTYYTNLGAARRTTESLQNQAMGRKAAVGAGMVGLGALLGGAGMSAISGQGRFARKALGALGVGAGLATAGAGLHNIVRRTRLSDLRSPMIMTNEGEVIPAYTEMKAASDQTWRPEMLHVALRHRDGTCADLPARRKLAFEQAVRAAEVHDELSPILGPTLSLEKIAMLLEQSIYATLR